MIVMGVRSDEDVAPYGQCTKWDVDILNTPDPHLPGTQKYFGRSKEIRETNIRIPKQSGICTEIVAVYTLSQRDPNQDCLGSFAWGRQLCKLRLATLAQQLQLPLQLSSFSFASSAQPIQLRDFRLATLASSIQLNRISLATFAWKLWPGSFSLETSAWKLQPGNVR